MPKTLGGSLILTKNENSSFISNYLFLLEAQPGLNPVAADAPLRAMYVLTGINWRGTEDPNLQENLRELGKNFWWVTL